MSAQEKTNHSMSSGRRSLALRTVAFCTLVAALVGIFASPAAATSTRLSLRPKVCGNVSGPHWSWGGKSGNQYAVYAVRGASCVLALRSVPRLVTQRPHQPDKRGADLTGPRGWGCLDTSRSIPHSGYCVSGTNTQFGWGPYSRRP